jgi:hypothetical protein
VRASSGATSDTTSDTSFDAATAVFPTDDPSVFSTRVDEQWTVGDKPHGGYLLSLLGRAARIVGRREGNPSWEVVSAAVTYLRPPDLAAGEVATTLLRRGRTAAHVRAILSQDGTDLIDAVFVVADLPSSATSRYDGTRSLDAPDPDHCVRQSGQAPGGMRVGLMDVIELRFDPATMPFSVAPRSEGTPAELRGWARFVDGREPDPLSLLFSLDACPPPTAMIGSAGWAPTLQLSAYVRARPAPGWLGIRMSAGLVADGMVDETAVLWDSRGQVVAQATQLARLRFPNEMG